MIVYRFWTLWFAKHSLVQIVVLGRLDVGFVVWHIIALNGNAQRTSKNRVEEFNFTAIELMENSTTLERFPKKIFRNGYPGRVHVITSCRVAIVRFPAAVRCSCLLEAESETTGHGLVAWRGHSNTRLLAGKCLYSPRNKTDVRIFGFNMLLGCVYRVNCYVRIRHVNTYVNNCSHLLQMLQEVFV